MGHELWMYILILTFSGGLSLSLCLFAHFKLRNAPGAGPYKILTLLSAIFAFSYAFELSGSTLAEIQFWLGIEYLFMPFIPVFTLLMCLEYAGHKLGKRLYFSLFIIPILTIFMHHTNKLHHFYYSAVRLRENTPFPVLDLEYGFWFYVHAIFLFVCLMFSMIILLLRLRRSFWRFRMQILLMTAGLAVPIVANHYYLNDLSPYGIDLGPVSMSISFILHGIALFSFQMFNLAPIARDTVFESMKEGVIVLNQNGAIVDFNQAMLPVMPDLKQSAIGKHIHDVLHGNSTLRKVICSGKNGDYVWENEGEQVHFQVQFSPVYSLNKDPIGRIISLADVTEKVNMQKTLKRLASIDSLTQIYNRAYFLSEMESSLSTLSPGSDVSLIMFDIDHFKHVNDTYGHEAGDLVLVQIAGLVKNSLRKRDIIGRYGGEEFMIYLPDTPAHDAHLLIEAIRLDIAGSPIIVDDNRISITSSFGLSHTNVSADNLDNPSKILLKHADLALYDAKRNGRNNVQRYGEILHA
ncbi:diguanylate cyclase [Cytobacillus oceanisediminis]|uniref:histidine kinase N-terminal 7TM domain-containing diguanylate cyclase n=1 Tax=Cytobacillus oceanisediminis TaxID=665099 RepID=UPI001C21973C|nr:histidine kinase N-terminal 7TM domain-containing protein [Cytobacillus oceanisediminis]MBU8730253.1 diguanylate cyclase [Cytobacillus oceanisediminis]